MRDPLYIVSDLHLGAGGKLDDFHYDAQFREFLQGETKRNGGNIELVVLGDAFDFLQAVPSIGRKRDDPELGSSEDESVEGITAIIGAHAVFFDALKEFLAAANTLRFVRGNHDVDLIWPTVQERIRNRITAPSGAGTLVFEKYHAIQIEGIHCEHGNQCSADNVLRSPDEPFAAGGRRLERCWGTYFVETVYNDIEQRFPLLDSVQPMWRGALLALRSARVGFTGRQMARFLRLAARARLPILGWIEGALMGGDDGAVPPTESVPEITSSDDFVKNLREDIQETVRERMKDDAFKREFDAEIQPFIQEYAAVKPALVNAENPNKTMGILTGKDRYRHAAEGIFSEHPEVQAVIFGHTHDPVNGNSPGNALNEFPNKEYFNSGSWTPCISLDDPQNKGKSLDELAQHAHCKDTLDFIAVTFIDDGDFRIELKIARKSLV